MNNVSYTVSSAIQFVQQLPLYSADPYQLSKILGIDVVINRPTKRDGYLICESGCKLIIVSSNIRNQHRRKFIISHELGHFLMHRQQLYCCSHVSEVNCRTQINTAIQESEANAFASEFLAPYEKVKLLLPNQSLTLNDISEIAHGFDISMTFSAMKAVQCSKTENEILLCYHRGKLKWYVCPDGVLKYSDIPLYCPIDLSSARAISPNVSGVWNSMYEGRVHQECF